MIRVILVSIFFLMNTQLYGLKYEPPKGMKNIKVNSYKKEKIKEKFQIIKQNIKNKESINGTNIRIKRR